MRRLAQEAGGLRSRTGMQAALLGCVFLGLFTEVLLSPYYPQFFFVRCSASRTTATRAFICSSAG